MNERKILQPAKRGILTKKQIRDAVRKVTQNRKNEQRKA